MKKRKYKIVLAVILALLVIGVIVYPVLAQLMFEHRWDSRTVIIDLPRTSIKYHVYGYSDLQPFEGTQVFYERWACDGGLGERVRCYSPGWDGSMSCFGGCAEMTPTVYYP